MTEFWSGTHTFHDGAGRLSDLAYFSIVQDDLVEDEINHAILIALDGDDWYQLTEVNWKSIGVVFSTLPEEAAICVGENGQVLTYFGGTENNEEIGHELQLLRNISIVEGICYVCGMNREVFRRDGVNNWVEIHADPPSDGNMYGFEAISGFSSDEMYAVGWNGEIWKRVNSNWSNCASPVNVVLTGITCTKSKLVYICGQNGALLRGRHDTWEVVSDDEVDEDLWDVVEFEEAIYVASKSAIYKIVDDSLVEVELDDEYISSAGRFSVNDGVLWSIGDKDIFKLDSVWTRID